MSKPRFALSLVFGLFAILFVESSGWADDATVLPKGVFRFHVDGLISLPITKRFNKDGDKEDIDTDFNANLDSAVFADLTLVELGFGLPAGTATFGRSVVDLERHIQIYTFRPAYGITDRLTIGAFIPYWVQSVDVKAQLDNSTATVGFNPLVPGGVAPIGFAGTPAPTTEDIQQFLESQGIKRLKKWENDHLGDILVGARYQYYKSDILRFAVTSGVRLPTGRWDDPNNLVDNDTGFEAWGLALQLQQDFVYQEPGLAASLGFPTPGSFFINTTFRYDAILPDEKPFRVCEIHNPVCPNLDKNVKRDVGDIVQAEIGTKVGLLFNGLTLNPIYTYSHKFKDKFSGDQGFDYDLLEEETNFDAHVIEVLLNYSTVPLFAEHKFPFPGTVGFRYWERFAGENNQFNSKYLGFTLQGFF